MAMAAEELDEAHLGNLAPLNSLTPELLEQVVANSKVERFPPGRRIFTEREDDGRTVFLLSGQIALMADGHGAVTVRADSDEASLPIAEQHPRQVTALASTRVSILSIETKLLQDLIEQNKKLVKDKHNEIINDQPDTIKTVLKTPLFAGLPEPHQQVLVRRMVEMPVKAGEVVIKEGDPSEFYYLIVAGKVRVTRKAGGNMDNEILITELSSGNGFGEGALIENDFHDSTVTMLEDGMLLRLSKGEFLTLLVRPYVKWLSFEEAKALQQEGAVLLDVRTPASFQRQHLPNSINLPLIIFRKAVTILDKTKQYVVCCDVGRRSATAAFLMAEQGLYVSILEGGVRKATQT